MNKSNMIWIRAGKSHNIYKISLSEYNKILYNKITEKYKLTTMIQLIRLIKTLPDLLTSLTLKINLVN